jgi:bacterioferritin-associated ferredoxin
LTERTKCTCHDIDEETFRAACRAGAHNVKTCFKTIGCLPKCNNCIPLVRSVLSEFQNSAQNDVALVAAKLQASKSEDTYEADVQDQNRPHAGQW